MAQTGGLVIRQLGQLAGAITARLNSAYAPPPNNIDGVNTSSWPSPLQPIAPIGPKGSEPLAIQYMMGQNLSYTPRGDSAFSAYMLKSLSEYPLARICIENVKDQLCRIPWTIQLKSQPGETKGEHKKRTVNDTLGTLLTKFFEYPDGEHSWSEWLRPIIEDMLVIDAASILIRRTKNKKIGQLISIRGETITRYIDDVGMTPQPPSPAYAQLWEGIPRIDLTTDDLVYKPRNITPRNSYSSQLYGFSPTEQNAVEIQVGAARLAYVLAFYAEGDIPNALQIVPSHVTPQKIKDAMTWMSSELSGNLSKRRKLFMTQGWTEDGKDQIFFPKEPVLADAFDDLHIRKICFGYGTSPQRLMRMMNRASAQSSQEASEEEGLMPWVDWVTTTVNYIIQRKAGYVDYEIQFNPYQELDIVKLSTAHKNLVGGGIETPNEAREAIGADLSSDKGANDLGITVGTGRVPIEAVAPPVPTPGGPGNGPGTPKRQPGASNGKPKAPKEAPMLSSVLTGPKKALGAEAAYELLKYKYGCVMVSIPTHSDLGQKISAMQDRIDPEHLRAKGIEKEMHVTVRYGFSGDNTPIQSYLTKQPPVNIKLGKTFAFDPTEHSDGAAPVCIKIESRELNRMNAELGDHGKWKEQDFDYHPHITLAYVDPEHAHEYVGWDDVEGEALEIPSAIISEANIGVLV